jgi:hypothetical protein
MGRNTLKHEDGCICYHCRVDKWNNERHPGGRRILTEDEMKEMWKRIDERKEVK